ncbi:MAG: DNA polymerase I [Acidobacteriota bacterium]
MTSSTSTAQRELRAPRLYLVDGYSNIFRAYYAIRNLSNTAGEPTNAVFGFLQMLRKLLRDEQPEYLGIAMDVSHVTVRKERYEEYKANRKPMPEDLRPQIQWIRELVEAFRIPLLERPGYEADDVLGTLAQKAQKEGFEVVLVSPDKDLMQLVGDGVFLHHTGRDKLYDARGIEEDFGVPPGQVVDVLALMGDSSDNVPGVPGIGEKGAKKLILEHGDLESLLDAAESIRRKSYREGLTNHREAALLSKELVTIHRDLDLPLDAEALKLEEPDWDALLELCWKLDFQAVAREIETDRGAAAPPPASAEEPSSVDDLVERLETFGPHLAITRVSDPSGDDAALGLAVLDAGPASLGFGAAGPADTGSSEDPVDATPEAPAVPLWVDFRRDRFREVVLDALRHRVADPQASLIGHRLKETLRLLGDRQEIRCALNDIMLASYLVRSALRGHEFAAVAMDRLHRAPTAEAEAGFDKSAPPPIGDERLLAFVSERVSWVVEMAPGFARDLATSGLGEVYRRFEEPLVPVLLAMEEEGVLLDTDFLAAMSSELGQEIEAVADEIYGIAGERFNLGSPQQLGEVMFEKLGYPVLRKTRKTRSYSTDAETLEALAARGFDLPERLLRWRELSKLKSTYVDALPQLVDARHRVHTRFNQAVAATGRLSSAHPNLQNIPVRTELGQRIRKAFRAELGHLLVVADYSQIELRLLAHVAADPTMIAAFRRGDDIHSATAGAVLGIAPELVTVDQRRMAKTINFGIIYGMTAFGLSRQLGISKGEAQTFIDTYLERYPGVRDYTERTIDQALASGRVETLYGRVRELPDIRSRNWNLRENAKRMAINAPIQGTAADLLKEAMIAVDRRLRAELPQARLVLTVHDELMLEGPEDAVPELSELLETEMVGVASLDVPLVVDIASGPTWYDAKA